MLTSYVEQLRSAGFTDEETSLNVERNSKGLFIDGVPNTSQHVFHVEDGHTRVGVLWLGQREAADPCEWYVYDVEVDEQFRARGLGRATMQAAEEFVKSRGGTKLALNVFGPNRIARGLYESMGYQVMAVSMRKELD
jgi:ribosomal protein S18 acetylase RimI-like enzyme